MHSKNILFNKNIKVPSLVQVEKKIERTASGSKKEVYYKAGTNIIHREGDKPAVIYEYGLKLYYKHGQRHRTQGPAYIDNTMGQLRWYREDKLDRADGPAVIIDNSQRYLERWYQNGIRHRIDGPAIFEDKGNILKRIKKEGQTTEVWFKENKVHREDGPAFLTEECEAYLQNSYFHREDDPAIIWVDKANKYFENGSPLQEKDELTDEEIKYFDMHFLQDIYLIPRK